MDERRASIVKECAIWENLRVRGGQDPFYPDGVNMNLTRNHAIRHAGKNAPDIAQTER